MAFLYGDATELPAVTWVRAGGGRSSGVVAFSVRQAGRRAEHLLG
jgi:hypothetical protein